MRPDWRSITDEDLRDPAALVRVLAAMGYRAHLGTLPWGAIRWWVPPYMTAPAVVPSRRAEFATVNRAMRDADVHLVADADAITAVCAYAGEWRTADGAQRGDDLPSLGAVRWGIAYGKAAARIARVIGLHSIPRLADA